MRILLDPAPTEGGGNPTPAPTPDLDAAFTKIAAKFNGDNAALARDAFATAERLRAENADLKGRLPKEGARVLSADEATAFDALASLGKADEVAAKLAAADEAVSWRAARERKDLLAEVGKLHGLDADVLADLPGIDKLAFEVRDVAVGSKTTRAAFVKGDDGKEQPADKLIETQYAKFLPALKAAAPQPPAPSTGPRRKDSAAPPSPDQQPPRRRSLVR